MVTRSHTGVVSCCRTALACSLIVFLAGCARSIDREPTSSFGEAITGGGPAGSAGDLCNIATYGAVGDGVTDDTAAITSASAACHGHMYIPGAGGCYLFNGTLSFSGNVAQLDTSFVMVGDGPDQSCIENTSPSSPTIEASAAEGGFINGVRFTHSLPAAGGDGIRFSGVNNYVLIENADFSDNDVGMNLTSTYFATLSNVSASNNLTRGISMIMTGAPGGPIQWQLFNVTASGNGGDGVYVTGAGAMGEINGLLASSNGGHGLEVSSDGGQPGAFRLKSSSFQGNHGWGLHLDAAGGDIVSCQFSGQGGGGVYASAANDNVSLSDVVISDNGYHGAYILAATWQVSGATLDGNSGSGFYGGAGYGRLDNVTADDNVNYGVFIDSTVTGATLMSVSGSGNGLGSTYPSATTASTVIVSGLPTVSPPLAPAPVQRPGLPAWSGLCSIRDYGAVGDGVTDDTQAINDANEACGGRLLIPASSGCYLFSGTLTFSGTSFAVVGDEQWQSCIQNTSPSSATIVASNTNGGVIYGLHLSHAPPFSSTPPSGAQAAPGGDGIRTTGTNDNLSIENVYLEANYIGLNLGPTNQGSVLDAVVVGNASHGISVAGTPIAWTLTEVVSEANGGDGMYVAGGGDLGTINIFQTYANAGHALELRGVGGPLYAQVSNCFLGEDLQYGLLIDTAGGTADVSSCQLESEGAGGIFATADNQRVSLREIVADHNAGHAIELLANSWQVVGGNIVGSTGSGIVGEAGAGVVMNVRSSGNTGCGVYMDAPVRSAEVVGVDAHDNGICALFPAASTATVTITGTVPN